MRATECAPCGRPNPPDGTPCSAASGATCQSGACTCPDGTTRCTVSSIPSFVWTLTAFPGVGAIAEPLYTVQFLPDGLVDIGADCNRAGGTWSGGDGALSITVTTSTRAYCPPAVAIGAVPARPQRRDGLHRDGNDPGAARCGRGHDLLPLRPGDGDDLGAANCLWLNGHLTPQRSSPAISVMAEWLMGHSSERVRCGFIVSQKRPLFATGNTTR